MKTILKTFMVLLVFVGVSGSVGVEEVEAAKTSTVSNYNIPSLVYWWNQAPVYPRGGQVDLNTNPPCSQYGCGWSVGLKPTSAKVQYGVKLVDVVTGREINDRASLPVGTKFRVMRHRTFTDISWFGTGYSADSPYGYFLEGAGPSPTACEDSNFLGDGYNISRFTYQGAYGIYGNLSVADKTPTIVKSGNLSCTGVGVDSICTVTAAGGISVGLQFPSTFGRYYYRYFDYRTDVSNYGCHANNAPMRTYSGYYESGQVYGVGSAPYDVPFSAKTITFNLTGTQAPTYEASCSAFNIPNTVVAGDSFVGTIKTKNNGNTTWNSPSGYYLGNVGSTDWGPNTLNLSGNTAPGQEYQFGSFGFVAPTTPGEHNFSWQMGIGPFPFGDICTKEIIVTSPSCTGAIPSSMNGVSHGTDEDQGVPTPTPWTYSSNDTGAKCEYTCASGYERQGNACVPIPGSCSAPPANSSFYDAEETQNLPYANYPSAYAASDTSTKCQTTCNAGYSWYGGSCVLLPDLTANPPTASAVSVRRGETITFTGLIRNTGLAAAGPYQVGSIFIDNNNDGWGDYAPAASSVNTNTNPNESQTTTASWTVPMDAPLGGNYRAGYFADNTNVVYEGAGDGNNANWSGWGASFTVADTPPPGAPDLTFSANPTSITEGDPSDLEWVITGDVDRCEGTAGSNGWEESKPFNPSNSEEVSPDVTTTYELECWNGTLSSGIKTATITVNPSSPPPSPPVVSFWADPDTVIEGEDSTLRWTITGGADTCTASDGWSGLKATNPTNSEEVGPLLVTTTYGIECINSDGSSGLQEAIVTVNVEPPDVLQINSDKKFIRGDATETAEIDWKIQATYDMDQCTVQGPGIDEDFPTAANTLEEGKDDSSPLRNAGVFTLTCKKGSQTFEDSVTVEIIPGTQET